MSKKYLILGVGYTGVETKKFKFRIWGQFLMVTNTVSGHMLKEKLKFSKKIMSARHFSKSNFKILGLPPSELNNIQTYSFIIVYSV